MRKVELTLEIKQETDGGFRLSDDGGYGRWIPKSQLDYSPGSQVGDTIAFEMSEWIATEKGFV